MVQFARTTISSLIDDMAKIFMIAFQKVKLDPVMHGDINTQICEFVEILGKEEGLNKEIVGRVCGLRREDLHDQNKWQEQIRTKLLNPS